MEGSALFLATRNKNKKAKNAGLVIATIGLLLAPSVFFKKEAKKLDVKEPVAVQKVSHQTPATKVIVNRVQQNTK